MQQEIEDRRQRAREAGLDAYPANGIAFDGPTGMLEAAIEAATRVQITPEIRAAHAVTWGSNDAKLRAAFAAAGFEVVEEV